MPILPIVGAYGSAYEGKDKREKQEVVKCPVEMPSASGHVRLIDESVADFVKKVVMAERTSYRLYTLLVCEKSAWPLGPRG
jgi:hypothetical protein